MLIEPNHLVRNTNRQNGSQMSVKKYVQIRADQYKQHDNIWGDLPRDAPIRLADIFEWILQNGQTFSGTNMEAADRLVEGSYRTPEIKACYHNALLVSPEVRYFEGWWAGLIPVEHAWNVVDDEVADVTLTIEQHRERALKDNQEYFGIEIPRTWMWKQIDKGTHFRPEGSSGPFIYDYVMEQIAKEREEE